MGREPRNTPDEPRRHRERVPPQADPILGIPPVTLRGVRDAREGAGVRGQRAADHEVHGRRIVIDEEHPAHRLFDGLFAAGAISIIG